MGPKASLLTLRLFSALMGGDTPNIDATKSKDTLTIACQITQATKAQFSLES